MKKSIFALLLAGMMALAGCSAGKKAEVTVEQSFAESGLLEELAGQYKEETGVEVVITTATPDDISKQIEGSQFDQCIITDGDETMAATIEQNGLLGGEFCFDSLMFIAPVEDRAGVAQLKDVSGADVLKHIALTQSNFVHPPADSALGKIEQALWSEAGIVPEGEWYIAAGSDGLGILDEAQARGAYALADRRSVALVASEYVSLRVVHANLKGMASSYFAFVQSPEEGGEDNAAQAFTRWLFSEKAQAIISGFDVMGDEPAYIPGKAAEYSPTLPTPAPEPTIPQTEAPQTETPQSEAPQTETPETSTPESQAPETSTPEQTQVED